MDRSFLRVKFKLPGDSSVVEALVRGFQTVGETLDGLVQCGALCRLQHPCQHALVHARDGHPLAVWNLLCREGVMNGDELIVIVRRLVPCSTGLPVNSLPRGVRWPLH